MYETMAPARHPLRSYVIALIRHGDLVSVAEAVTISGASAQAVRKWIKAEGLDIQVRRGARIATYTTNAQRYLDGLPPLRKPTKAEMRRELAKAMRRFNAANAAKTLQS